MRGIAGPVLSGRLRRRLLPGVLALALVVAACGGQAAPGGQKVAVGFIVKDLGNPYFEAMHKAAQAEAQKRNVNLIFEAGKYDGDNATQVSQIDNLITRQVKVIAVVPNLSSGIVPAVKRATNAGIKVMAIDTATEPASATDTFIATDNYKAGVLNGQWAKASMAGRAPVLALLEGTPGSSVNTDRMGGFLQGFGAKQSDAVSDLITNGEQGKGQTAMENALTKNPDINLVWTINEPAALGAAAAVQERGLQGKVTIVSMDGGCRGIKAVQSGQIATDVMQFPARMAQIAIDDAVTWVNDGKAPPKKVDTGETLVTTHPQGSVASKDPSFGLANCWASSS